MTRSAQLRNRTDDVPVAVRRVKVRRTVRDDTILQHPVAVAIHPAYRQVLRHIFPRDDFIDAALGEEVGPVFKTIVVDAVDVSRQQLFDYHRACRESTLIPNPGVQISITER
jgi:hypothetical protein